MRVSVMDDYNILEHDPVGSGDIIIICRNEREREREREGERLFCVALSESYMQEGDAETAPVVSPKGKKPPPPAVKKKPSKK